MAASLWGQGMKFGGLNGNGPHRLIESGTIRRYGFIRTDVALLEEVSLGGALRFPMLKLGPVLPSFPADPSVEPL